ncbi:MAG: DUF3352 domain-containing protein [Alistipes sp.]|nr:DUF3352 domain-containing protein [Alistipes sp.]
MEEVQPKLTQKDNAQEITSAYTNGTTGPENQSAETSGAPLPRKKKRFGFGRIMAVLGLLLLGWITYTVIRVYVTPDRNLRQIYLVPENAAIIIRSAEPVRDWQKFSSSEPWQRLKQAESFAEISENVDGLDSLLRSNKTLMSLVGKRDLTVSLHPGKGRDWDFLIVIDLRKASKLEILKDQVENIMKLAGSDVSRRNYNDINILEMRDPDGQTLYCAFVDNHFVASYSSSLLHASIDERGKPKIGLEESFIEAEKLVGYKGLYRVFLNYSYLPRFLSIYLGAMDETLLAICNSMEFAGMWLDAGTEKIELKGYSLMKDIADPYVAAILGSGKNKLKVMEFLPARTALYADIGFDNASAFLRSLEEAMRQSGTQGYDDYVKMRDRIEKMFRFSIEKDFFGWMAGEFAYIQLEPGLLGMDPEMLLAVRAKNIKEARSSMANIEKRIRGASPIKVKSVEYKGYDVNYVELKGFFRLFFGKLFDRFEKPYYTYVGDFVVFSNKAASILSFIEDVEQKNLLRHDPAFRSAISKASSSSTFFLYMDTHKFYPQLQGMLAPETWNNIKANRDVLFGFPRMMMQVTDEKGKASLQMVIEHIPFGNGHEVSVMETVEEDLDDAATDDREQTEKELMSELKKFYVEKFEGNVLRDYYEDGSIKSESEIKNGMRHGRYREFHPNGALRLRGKYVKGSTKGTWKYYTEDGKFDRKEKK